MTRPIDFTEGYREQHATNHEQLQSPDEGLHNINIRGLFDRTYRGDTYKDRSTIMVVPAVSNPACKDETGRDIIPVPPKVAGSWLKLQTPANQRWSRLLVENCEVGDAYNQAVSIVLNDEGFRTWTWLLTAEVDNIPPADGLLQLIEDVETVCGCTHIQRHHDYEQDQVPCKLCQCTAYKHTIDYDVIGGVYFAKGEGGFCMAFGQADELPRNYRPWIPPPNAVSEVCALGMGFTLFRIDMFKHIPAPWFRTVQEWVPGIGERMRTQDIDFFDKAAGYGYRFAISTNVRVGHIASDGIIW